MKIIRFEFNCIRQVPLYAELCNYYLTATQLDISVAINIEPDSFNYYIEAAGTQSELENLADDIAQRFLISTWLIDSKITLITNRIGSKNPLLTVPANLEFCHICQPKFGDNQAPEFGEINLICPNCHGEKKHHSDYTLSQLKQLVKEIKNDAIEITIENEIIRLYLHQNAETTQSQSLQRSQHTVLVCNPNSINAHFHLNEQQVFALSSIEKPLIRALPKESAHTAQHAKDATKNLIQPFYQLGFASNRVLVVVSELLRQSGYDFVFMDKKSPSLSVTRINQSWSEITSYQNETVTTAQQALFDNAKFGNYLAQYNEATKSTPASITVKPVVTNKENIDYQPSDAAICALHASNITKPASNHQAILYFSDKNPSKIAYLADNKENTFFVMPTLPTQGTEIYNELLTSSPALFEKFQAKYPADYEQLLAINFSGRSDNLPTLWAIAAILLGFARPDNNCSITQLSELFQAQALLNTSDNSPRIDFPIIENETSINKTDNAPSVEQNAEQNAQQNTQQNIEQNAQQNSNSKSTISSSNSATNSLRTLDWRKTLASLVSFRLAENNDDNLAKIAYGTMDSFADYVSTWVEYIDKNVGIDSLALAGNSFCSEVLSQCIALRLGKNFKISINRQLDLDGNNLAVGALYLKRRRF